eukprot:6460566-Amphidinium_carterae.1
MSRDNTICSWSTWIDLHHLVGEADEHHRDHNPNPAKKHKKGTAFTEEELLQYPWLQSTVEKHVSVTGGTSSSSTSRRIPDDYDETRLQDALQEFQRKKMEWETTYAQEEHFVMVVKGGRWAQAVLNTNFHLVEAKAKTEDVARWCQMKGFNRLASFTFTKYTERGASLLAQLWCHRMSHYYTHTAAGTHSSSTSERQDVVSAYVEPEAASILVRNCGNLQAVQKRLTEIRAMRPTE